MKHALSAFLLLALAPAASTALAADAAKAAPTANVANAASAAAPSDNGYRLPPPELRALVDAPRAPQLTLGPKRDLAALMQVPTLPGIELVAQPELKLAGLRINPRAYSASRFSFGTDLWLLDVASGKELRLQGLPQPLAIASTAWSPDQRHLAFNQVDMRSGANELWLVEVATRRARRLATGLNNVVGRGYSWMPDGASLLVQLQPANQGPAPAQDLVPTGPAIQESRGGGGVKSLRTYQDLLRNEGDARVFAHYLRSQLARVGVDGAVTPIGAPDLYYGASPSPDGKWLLAQRIERPFSYLVPVNFFPRRIEVLGMDGAVAHEVARLPLFDGLPTGNDAVPTGVRNIRWRSDAPATLAWAEAQDGGDPAREATVRDAVFMHAAPFTGPKVELARLGSRLAGLTWGRGDLAVLDEFWWKSRQTRRWRIAPDAPQTPARLMYEGSAEDRYKDPGYPVTEPDAAGNARLMLDGERLFLIGAGASPEGDRPFLDRLDLSTGVATRLFHSAAPYYEAPAVLLDSSGTRLVTTRESPAEPSNYYRRDLASGAAPVALTRFPHPTPQLKGVQKEQIRYTRADGVELTGTLYLPPSYRAGRDAPLPLLMWAYPQEFKSASAASQVTDSPYRFNAIGYWGPQAFLARGYAVLDDPSMPIVGEGTAEPNDTYLQQLTASAQAAVDEVVRRGVADRHRIAIGGHSYGAFMTANLLAHTRLFRAGIARSGAYNRTLTPFGFQAEERNFWQAPAVYTTMSPFNHADRIRDPLLLIHGEQDNNSGTFPIQSERLFTAIKGLGGEARLVMLPNESHSYRARESVLHMLAESDAWLEQYVKNAKPRDAAMPAAAAVTPAAAGGAR